MNNNGWIIVAPDTDAGKTFITAGLFRQFLLRGVDCLAVKPVQTGCEIDPQGHVDAPDINVYLAAVQGRVSDDSREKMLCYAYRTPCSPALAGELSGHMPELDVISAHIASLANDVLLIETAGGLFTPINKHSTMLDLIKLLGLPVLVVADNRVGTINQVLMTTTVLRQYAVDIRGVILTHRFSMPDQDFILKDNIRTISQLARVSILADIPFILDFQADRDECWTLADPFFSKIVSIIHS